MPGDASDFINGDSADDIRQVFDDPIPPFAREFVRRRAVLPHRVGDGFERVGLEFRLCQQAADEAREQVAAAALREVRIAGGVHEDVAVRAADERLMAFQHDPAIAVLPGDFPHGVRPVGLHFFDGGLEQFPPRRGAV